MKLPLISPLIAFGRQHALALAAAFLALALAVGAYSGWRYYEYRQSSEYAFLRLQEALQPPDPQDLARRVDFNTLSAHLAEAIAKNYPFLKKGPDQIRDLKAMLQTGLLKQMLHKVEASKEEEDPQKRLQEALYVLPPDFQNQLAANLSLQSTHEGTALLNASIRHPLLDKEFPLLLRMDQTADGWLVRDLANAEELVAQFRAAQVKRMEARRGLILQKNEQTRRRMDAALPVQSCTASAGLLSDGKTLLLVAHVLARNTGSVGVNNMNLSATFSGPEHKELLHRYLNAVQPVRPGEDFERRWTIELDGTSPLGQSVLAAGKISCSANWRTLGLASGEVLHLSDVPALVEDFQ